MPTGYTAPIISEKGIEFEAFVLNCSRAFGAMVSLRDESMGSEIPEEFEVSTHHKDQIEKYEVELDDFMMLKSSDYKIRAQNEFDEALKAYNKSVDSNKDKLYKYEEMLKKVNSWKEPSPEHLGLKKFMIEQIESSLDFDIYELTLPVLLTPEAWANKELKRITKDISYHEKEWKAEQERVEKKNKWLKQLRISLGLL